MHDFYLLGDHITPPAPIVLPAAGMYTYYEITFPSLNFCMHAYPNQYIICIYKTTTIIIQLHESL